MDDLSEYSICPFGNPDGSRANLDDLLKDFVTFGGGVIWGGLAIRANDLTTRVIIGRKGSGKTVYLRYLQAYTSDQESIYSTKYDQGLPTTEDIILFCGYYEERCLTEKWMLLWRRAIMRSVLSHLTKAKGLKEKIDKNYADDLFERYAGIVRNSNTDLTIYSQVVEIIREFNTRRLMDRYLEHPHWVELENEIAEIIVNYPPICFYVDAVDEEFAHAPMYWLRCQKGLFYQTMRLLREPKFGGRLHIVICIRDIVLSSVLRSEHSTRYYKEPHIRILGWNKEAIKYFLRKKVSELDDIYFSNDCQVDGKNVSTWLGVNKIKNYSRGVDEDIIDYLLRHTRLLPRDVVILGNSLCEELQKFRYFHNYESVEEVIRMTVGKVSAVLGNEQLKICGNHLASNVMPVSAAKHNYSHVYTSNAEYVQGETDKLKRLIGFIGKDRFSKKEMEASFVLSKDLFGEGADPYSIMWQNGLLGYEEFVEDKDRCVFHTDERLEDFLLPSKENYVFHSSLIDAVDIKPIGEKPVRY